MIFTEYWKAGEVSENRKQTKEDDLDNYRPVNLTLKSGTRVEWLIRDAIKGRNIANVNHYGN